MGMTSKSMAEEQYDNTSFQKPEYMDLLDRIIQAETRYGLTGAQSAVYKDGSLVKDSSYGYLNNYYNLYNEDGE